MGCLNSEGQFSHWFANIHLSGPCNRSCYFCIGQHMMALDKYNVLTSWPLPGLDKFVEQCKHRNVSAVYVTGTNTDPLLYRHTGALLDYLDEHLPGVTQGVRTNGAQIFTSTGYTRWACYQKASVTICSTQQDVYNRMMGPGKVPDIARLFHPDTLGPKDIKVNIVLGPENLERHKNPLMPAGMSPRDIDLTFHKIGQYGPRRINVREPYGQPHIGDPLMGIYPVIGEHLGMPIYRGPGELEITYWDVHYVEVESVNLYASGRVSETYPITKGCDENGIVLDQSNFAGGRIREQWVS